MDEWDEWWSDEPAPRFQHGAVQRAWEECERRAVVDLRLGQRYVSPTLSEMRIADDLWADSPTGYVYCLSVSTPDPDRTGVQPIELIKLGYSKNPHARSKDLETGSPFPLTVDWLSRGTRRMEARLHGMFSDHRVHGEWFDQECGAIRIMAALYLVTQAWESLR